MTEKERYEKFVKELEFISLKYGVQINSCGGVDILDNDQLLDLKRVEYDCDHTSGDLNFKRIWKDEVPTLPDNLKNHFKSVCEKNRIK